MHSAESLKESLSVYSNPTLIGANMRGGSGWQIPSFVAAESGKAALIAAITGLVNPVAGAVLGGSYALTSRCISLIFGDKVDPRVNLLASSILAIGGTYGLMSLAGISISILPLAATFAVSTVGVLFALHFLAYPILCCVIGEPSDSQQTPTEAYMVPPFFLPGRDSLNRTSAFFA